MRRNNLKGFTLAEVLITLTIIGVIAALTIPNLMQSWRRHERITQIKTAYSIIQNATKMAVAEHGNVENWNFSSVAEYVNNYFLPYVKIQQKCGTNDAVVKNCFINNNKNGFWFNLNGNAYTSSGGYGTNNFYTLVLQNGMHVAVWAPTTSLQSTSWNRYIHFYVDVNGKQGQTTLGKDVFTFNMSMDTGKFLTGGRPTNHDDYTDCVLTGLGTSCAYWIEKNHWEFPDDYPVRKF